ncbi:MAG: helix-turn-helix transcriptional regulator [Tannerella sp.]|jgi:transcriptional regulator with XRE-family HTH domain|nr:helix-turn-helix transcriptional regulator [Tannerella sp.]
MKDRISQLMKAEGFPPSKFADEIGIQRAVISHISTGRNDPSKDVIIKILERFPDINPDWLLFGRGHMRRNKADNDSHTTTALPNLFENAAQTQPERKKTTEIRQETEVKRPTEAVQPQVKETIEIRETPARKIVRIMVFYSNNTHEIFVPEK